MSAWFTNSEGVQALFVRRIPAYLEGIPYAELRYAVRRDGSIKYSVR
jgi:hypothetical protein